MNRILALPFGIAAVLLFSLAAPQALAQADVSGSVVINEPYGFPMVCDQPCYVVEKSVEVYLPGNASVPAGANCPAGDTTYLYTLEHTGGSGTPLGFIPAVTEFEMAVASVDVTSAGEIPGFGISPTGTTINAMMGVVSWAFTSPPISSGTMSTKLFICSPLRPGTITDNTVSVSGQASLDAPGTCHGPNVAPPEDGEPIPCTIGFWTNRSLGTKGTLQHFPDPGFDEVVDQAVVLSGGTFADANALLADLQSKGSRPRKVRARQQFAAFLLNLAAGDLFPENSKCKTFEENAIDDNSCGTNTTIGGAYDLILANLAANAELARGCADDTNNGIGVLSAIEGE